jgi:hypothetical protein
MYSRCLLIISLSLVSLSFTAGFAEETPDVNILFFEEWMTHWPMKALGDVLSSNQELAAHPKVNGEAVRNCYKPVQAAFEKSMRAYFGQANNEPVTDQEHVAKFMEAHTEWRQTVRDFMAFAQGLPITLNIAVSDKKASYAGKAPAPVLYANVPFQTLVMTIAGKHPEAAPRYREESVDLSLYRTVPIRTDGQAPELIRLNAANLPESTHSYPVTMMDQDGRTLAVLPLKITGKPSGSVKVTIVDDQTGKPTPSRVGIYGKNGFFRASNAVPLYVYEKIEFERPLYDPMWPSEDKRVFYSAGQFEMGLPPGEYRILVRKGIERLLYDKTFTITKGKTCELSVPMVRWADMPKRGWYSGDDHVHIRRNGENNVPIMHLAQAEDIHVCNVVQMDDVNSLSFLQYAWGDQGMFVDGDYVLRSGQEGPRTGFRGHTLFYNLTHSIHDHNSYYIYEDVFDQAHRMGGLGGYAHNGVAFGAERGMSIVVPVGNVDFLEVMQTYGLDTDVLHHFWNMGFRLVPTAGSDFPYNPAVGDVLVYVYVDGPFSFDKWFEGLKAGHTFVTSGPMLEFSVNGQLPGSEIAFEKSGRVTIHAAAEVCPTLDKLLKLEVIQFGQPIQTAEAKDAVNGRLELNFDLDVSKSTWIAARAFGERSRGQTAAVFIPVGGAPTWNTDTLAADFERVEQKLKEIEAGMTAPGADDVLRANASQLNHYIKVARERYSTLQQQAGIIQGK